MSLLREDFPPCPASIPKRSGTGPDSSCVGPEPITHITLHLALHLLSACTLCLPYGSFCDSSSKAVIGSWPPKVSLPYFNPHVHCFQGAVLLLPALPLSVALAPTGRLSRSNQGQNLMNSALVELFCFWREMPCCCITVPNLRIQSVESKMGRDRLPGRCGSRPRAYSGFFWGDQFLP